MDAIGVAVRFALYLDLGALFGLAAFGLYALRGEERSGAGIAFRPLIAGTALLGLLVSALGLAALAAGMASVPLISVGRDTVEMILTGTGIGTAWLARVVALILAFVLALVGRGRPAAMLTGAALAGAVALASLAWAGHGAMDEGAAGWVHLVADIAHLLAAGVWTGALIALLLLVFRRRARVDHDHLILSHRALAGFSTTGTVTVAVILVTGLINGWMLIGPANIVELPATLYGQLLLAKLLLFGAMVALAAANRFRLVPAFERALAQADPVAASNALRCSLAVEAGCALAVLALVAWLGTLAPLAE